MRIQLSRSGRRRKLAASRPTRTGRLDLGRLLVLGAVSVLVALAPVSPAPAQAQAGRRPGTPDSTLHTLAREIGGGGNTRWQAADRRGSSHRGSSHPGHSARGARAVPLGTSTQSFAVDARTGTAYVSSDDGTISVVDVAHCNLHRSASCAGPVAELTGPSDAIGVTVYRQTLYVTSGVSGSNGALSVYDVSRCRTGDTTRCAAAVATVPLADIPVGLALDDATGTLYAGNVADHVDVLALASCRTGHLSGCSSAVVGSIPATDGPVFPTFDGPRHTLYVPANGPGADASGNTVHVVDLSRCHAGSTSGCAAPEASLPADFGAVVAYADDRTGTLYVQNQGSATLSVLDVRRCTGAQHVGCAQTPTQVPVGANASGGIVVTDRGRLFEANSDSDTLSTFDTHRCRAGDTSGCPTSPSLPAASSRADGAPFALAYDRNTRSIFTVEHSGKALGVLDANACSGRNSPCRHLLPFVDGDQQELADQAVHTWYGTDEDGNLTLTDTRLCTAKHAKACRSAAIHTSQTNSSHGQLVADDSTHSLYLVNNDPETFEGSVVVLDTRTCNAAVHTRCSPVAPAMPLPDFTAVIALDPSSHTVYVTTQDDSSLQVIDGTRCNAIRQTACSAPVGEVPLDGRIYGVAVDPSTRTVYISEFGNDFDSDVVYAVDSTHCRSTDVTGCGRAPKQFTSGLAPLGMVVDHAHHSLYVLASAGGDHEGQVEVLDTRTCSARGTVGCRPAAAFDVGRSPFAAALDPVTRRLFVADFEHAAVSVIDTQRCNTARTAGCVDRQLDVGDQPGQVAIDPATHSVFVLGARYNHSYYVDARVQLDRH